MLANLLVAWCLMAFCVAIHATGLIYLLRWLRKQPAAAKQHVRTAVWILIRVAGWTILLHLTQIAVWAFHYCWAGAMPDLTTAAYFSVVTYTTTGYGDLVLPQDWRLVGGVESLTGILMCGLSTGMFFAVFSEFFIQSRGDTKTPAA
ncbi:potassium channel family protein [Roseimicrobium sp. ORNL1]|uniref:potassium channel family protein n=1 Tax=Roseimicrobium sp. ORNL1 TaxID=2711231 RepID=UPI0013E115DC|nr:potassium channel family protein [Roseimicrobium sp. ORNL1]QIF02309.1 two pore domain potassium channel family protein [Roseimicrobium sp. ORNL1]